MKQDAIQKKFLWFWCLIVLALCQLPGSAMPQDPFERLLSRLDNAPLDLEATARNSQRANSVQRAAESFSRTMAPLTPVLQSVANNRVLVGTSRIPILGAPVQQARQTLNSVIAINRNFTRLVELDKKQVMPLRIAAINAATLKRTRSRRDLPAAVRSFRQAYQLLTGHEQLLQQQRQRLNGTLNLMQQLSPTMQRIGSRVPGWNPQTWKAAEKKLQGIQTMLAAKQKQLGQLRSFTGECLQDGQAALKS